MYVMVDSPSLGVRVWNLYLSNVTFAFSNVKVFLGPATPWFHPCALLSQTVDHHIFQDLPFQGNHAVPLADHDTPHVYWLNLATWA